jgi:glucose/arabinose dehydrogenase
MKPQNALNAELLEDRLTPSTLPPGFTEQVIATGINSPTTMSLAGDGRIFVAQQNGDVRIIQGGNLLPTSLIHINTLNFGENGLVGLTLDPNFASNGYFYAYYLVGSDDGSPDFNRVSRFTATGNIADPASEKILLNLDPIAPPASSYTHNGGAMHFGQDGKLYITTGDNIDGPSAQNLDSFGGKVLRINPDGTIPADNPTHFQGVSGTTTGEHRAIYAIGFRNPFTFDVQPGTGKIYINDVGEDTWEEIDELHAGANYGWPATEGATSDPRFTGPIFTYHHGFSADTGLAITGGAFYDPAHPNFPGQYNGDYFFVDFVNNWIHTYNPATGKVDYFASNLTRGGAVDLDVDSNGDLYYLARGTTGADAGIYRIRLANYPAIAQQPGGARLTVGGTVTLSVIANGAGPLRYQWTRNGFNIAGATGPTLTIKTTAVDDQATYRIVVSNDFGAIVSNGAVLTVTTSTPPTAKITSPSADIRFVAGQTITVNGLGTDPESGVLPGSAMTWTVDYHTGSAPPRPFVTATTGTSVTFTVPTLTPYTRADVFYRITLTVTDPTGYTDTTTLDLQPQTALVTVAATSADASVTVDGQPMGQIDKFTGVAGLQRTLSVPASVTENGQVLPFIGWFDGETSPTRTISSPSQDTTYLAIYKQPKKTAAGVAVGAGAGGGPVVKLFDKSGDLQSQQFAFDPNFRNGVSVATADFDGDGVPDLAVANGPGLAPTVTIYDGATGVVLKTLTVFEPDFLGGVNISAADFDGDGLAELIVTPGPGGGPRVRVLKVTDGSAMADFFGIADSDFRGGCRAAAGDINGDGKLDIVVAAGDGGGPRIAGWDGAALMQRQYVNAFSDFFAFDPSLRGGAFVSLGDLDGTGVDDIILGAGVGGAPQVVIRKGDRLVKAATATTDNSNTSFFVGDVNARGGLRVVARDINGDGKAEIIAAPAGDVPPVVSVVDGTGHTINSWKAFPTPLDGGVFVG